MRWIKMGALVLFFSFCSASEGYLALRGISFVVFLGLQTRCFHVTIRRLLIMRILLIFLLTWLCFVAFVTTSWCAKIVMVIVIGKVTTVMIMMKWKERPSIFMVDSFLDWVRWFADICFVPRCLSVVFLSVRLHPSHRRPLELLCSLQRMRCSTTFPNLKLFFRQCDITLQPPDWSPSDHLIRS